MNNSKIHNMVFFGTSRVSVYVLDELEKQSIVPSLIVTVPDKPRGRKMIVTASEVKRWGDIHDIPTLQPEKLSSEFIKELKEKSPNKDGWNVFIVVAYGKILPVELLEIPQHHVLNVHPSLLPRLRGPNPIRGAILEDNKEVGVSIMQIDSQVDHGPILAQEKVEISPWPPRTSDLEEILVRRGGEMLAEILPQWLTGEITPYEQDHQKATFTKKIIKEDGLLNLRDDPYQNFLKIRAYEGWPGTYFFVQRNDKKIRIKIVDAVLEDDTLVITRIIPEGKNEMNYRDFIQS